MATRFCLVPARGRSRTGCAELVQESETGYDTVVVSFEGVDFVDSQGSAKLENGCSLTRTPAQCLVDGPGIRDGTEAQGLQGKTMVGAEGRPSNPTQRHLFPSDIDNLITAYQAGATISQLAAEFGAHRTTIAAPLDRRVPQQRTDRVGRRHPHGCGRAVRHRAVAGHLADEYGTDAQTVANRFRQRAGVPVRSRRGWSSVVYSEPDRR